MLLELYLLRDIYRRCINKEILFIFKMRILIDLFNEIKNPRYKLSMNKSYYLPAV